MEALKNRYENKKALVDIYITEILSVPKIQSENPVQLRFLIDTVRSHLRSLKNLRMDSNVLSDAILLHMLNSKIDRESQRLFQLDLKTTEVPSLQDFFSFLETRCIQLESIRKTDFDTKSWNTVDKTLRSFWGTENISEEQPIISDELSYCEKHFEKTHFRKPCGRYSISLPFKENIQENVNLGDSRSIASKRLDQLWRRLDRDSKLKNLYTKSIEEYLSLDHMDHVSPSTNHIFTKRDVLSQNTRIFDPLGLLGPVISKSKFFMQQLWLLKLEWHEKLPVPVAAEWASFVQYLPVLEKLKIPRFALSENLESIILYGFSDASEKGFGAVTYVSVIKNNGDRHSQLLCSKSRVAPLKTVTIPRLELSACLLLSKLVRKVINALKMNLSQVILFSDSTIALSWIKTPPHLLKTFVANRVAKIQELTVNFSWHHISS
ncbi:integrase catalytic domain-containing protein [Trichonephila inaurata madagascariensis]|uniref:Integrase catalytic domain-containing protein n=1 Tax=Trichonephila inaurata madagascariensis TaxID=2747483 RepID=A0A8X6IPE1_9ARAC|nr:integrase catalytic domain-containing protein [Trichonephila inaurata madagascariensis]